MVRGLRLEGGDVRKPLAAIGMVLLCLALGGAALLAAPESGRAQSIVDGGTIDEIVIRGAQRIEPTTVRSYLPIDPGDQFDVARLNRALKNLFDSGLFKDATLTREGDRLIVNVVENPIINRIAFEGNEALDDESLRAEVQLRPRVVYTRTKVQRDVKRLREVYRRNGHFGAKIDPKIIERDQNRVDLVFEISEGPETVIEGINFIGNEAFSDDTLRGEIATTVSVWWNFLTSADTYDPDRLTFDRELLRRFYLSEGYADFQVNSAVAELTPDGEGFVVTFTVEEGPRYRFGEVSVESKLKNLDPKKLRKQIEIESDAWYDATEVDSAVDVLTSAVGEAGFAFVDINPRVRRDTEDRTIDVTFQIEEGPKVFVERINVTGNVRTVDRVIRREFQLIEGDAFNAAKLRRSRQRIQNLGFFKSVEVDNVEGSEPDKTVINVKVEEQSTGSLSLGGGFSTSGGPLANITIRERNLLGQAQDLRLNLLAATTQQAIDLSFTEPYFLGRNLSAGVDVFATETSQDELTFDEQRRGGALRTGYQIVDRWRQNWRYELSRREIDDVDNDAALAIQLEEGTANRSSVTHSLSFRGTDSNFNPTEGISASISNTFAGVGGGVTFIKNTISADYFQPIVDPFILHLGGEFGQIKGLGEDTRILDRFFIGSQKIRGFQPAGLGPRDEDTDDALGARRFYVGTVEARFPLPLPDQFDIRGRLFTDIGAAWGVDNAPGAVLDENTPRISIGTGVSWASPLGPVQIDLGFPIQEEDFDETETLRFSFGTQF